MSHQPKRSFWRATAKVILWITLPGLGFIAFLLALLFIYEKEVKAAVVAELNKYLKAEVRVRPEHIDLTVIRTFPDCSIRFRDLLMLEALPGKNRDTLLFAGQLSLHFNIRNLWNGRYEIDKIRLKDALIKPVILKDGSPNYEFWKRTEKKTTAANDSVSFNLKLISIENSRLVYKNRKLLHQADIRIPALQFRGKFRDDEFEMHSEADLLIGEFREGNNSYMKDKRVAFSLHLDVNGEAYTLKKSSLSVNKLALALEGRFKYSDSLERLELSYHAPRLDISGLLSLLPGRFREQIRDYESSGDFYAEGTVRYLNSKAYSLVSNFGIRSGEITYKPNSTTAKNVALEGYLNYSNAGSILNLKNIHLNLKTDEIKGSCLLENFSDPYLQLKAEANVRLENLLSFWPVDTLTHLKGGLEISTEIEAPVKLLKDQALSGKVKLALEAKVNGLEATFKHDEKTYGVEHCIIRAREREIEVKDLKLRRGSSDLTLNGRMPGIFNYLLDRSSPLVITGSLESERLRLDDFITGTKTSASGPNDDPLIPPNVSFKLHTAISKFDFGKFSATAITGEIEIRNQKAVVSDVKLRTMNGEAEIHVFADNSKKRLDVALQSRVSNISITELFSQLNNFGQSTLTDRHLKGSASALIDFSGSWNNRLEADLKSIYASCDLSIRDGELNDFKPLLSLSRFVDVEELKRVRFASLQSQVEIKNKSIVLPKTSIRNSAMDLEIWGTHSFENTIDYHIQLLISQYLAKKRKKADSEFGPVENDPDNRRCAFIRMTGTIDDPKIRYDVKGQKEKIREDIAREKKNMKQILKEEWNLFKKDTALKAPRKEAPAFELEKPESPAPKKSLELKRKDEDDMF